jgi:anti-anti-sigma factor
MPEGKPFEFLEQAAKGLSHFTARAEENLAKGSLTVYCGGYLDGDAANMMMSSMVSLIQTWAGGNRVVIDLSKLEYISSLGIGMLSTMVVTSHTRGITMNLQSPQPSVLHVLELLGIPQFIPILGYDPKAGS